MCATLTMLLLLAGTEPTVAQFRTWTDATGKYHTEAQFVDLKDGQVRLRKKDDSTVTVPIEKLSETDQKYVRESRYPFRITDIRSNVPMRLNPSMPGQGGGHPLCAFSVRKVGNPQMAEGYALFLTVDDEADLDGVVKGIRNSIPFKGTQICQMSFDKEAVHVTRGRQRTGAIHGVRGLLRSVPDTVVLTLSQRLSKPATVRGQVWSFSGGTWAPVSGVVEKKIVPKT